MKKYATLCLDGKRMLFVVDQSSIIHQNKSYDYENNNKYRQKSKILLKSARRQCQSENFTYDHLKVFFEPLRTINNRIM